MAGKRVWPFCPAVHAAESLKGDKIMPMGKVKWFNNAKGYGFIVTETDPALAGEDLFAHFSAIQMEGYKTLKAGQEVRFDVQPSGKGYHAVNIVPVEEVPQATGPERDTGRAQMTHARFVTA